MCPGAGQKGLFQNMNLGKGMIFILGIAGMVVPARASLSFNIGSSAGGSLNNAISSWDTASDLNYLSSDIDFTGSLSGSPETYTDPTTGILFEDFSLSGSTNGTQQSIVLSGTTLESTQDGIIELTDLGGVYYFAAEFQVQFTSSNLFCIGVNVSSFNQSGNCDETFAAESASDTVFVGVSSTTPITNIWIGPGASFTETLEMQNFDVPVSASDASAPDAPTLLLLGTGLLLLGAFRFRRRRAATLS